MENTEIKNVLENNKYFTNEQIEQYKRDGFLIVRQMYSPEEVKEISNWIDDLKNRPEEPGKHWVYYEKGPTGMRVLSRIEKFVEYHEKLGELVKNKKILGRVSELFGQPAVLYKEKINFKMPGGLGFEPHQDIQAGWDDYTNFFISVAITIDENTIENGCLELSAGHHKKGLLGKNWKPLSEEDLKGVKFTKFPTKPGDVAFFDCFVPHKSAINTTSMPRRNLYLTYNYLSAGDFRDQYYTDKHKTFPPDIERTPGKEYGYKV